MRSVRALSAYCLVIAISCGIAEGQPSGACVPDAVRLERIPWPVDGALGETFGMRPHPLLGRITMHTGIDFTAPAGEPVRVPARGEVLEARYNGPLGNHVRIRHGGGLETSYSHLARIEAKAGDCLDAGAILGRVGNTGLSVGPHLHFEVLREAIPIDPAPLLEPIPSAR